MIPHPTVSDAVIQQAAALYPPFLQRVILAALEFYGEADAVYLLRLYAGYRQQ